MIEIKDTLDTLLDSKKFSAVKDVLTTMNEADIAALFKDIPEEKAPLLFRLIPKELAADSFAEMDPEIQEILIHGFSDTELHEVINELYVDDAVDLVEEMPANVVKRILSQASPDMRNEINGLLRYADNSAGSVMTTEYLEFRPEMTVGEVIPLMRKKAADTETIYTCYVTDKRKLLGVITLKDLFLAKSDEVRLDSIMEQNVIAVHTGDDREEVARMLSKYNFLSIPVLDGEERLVGIITFDDAMDVMEQETTEDIEIMAAMSPSKKDYVHAGPFTIFKQRIPWLLILMISATFTGMIITGFENALAAQVVLTAFIPMLMDTGGNSGSQSSVTVIRMLSLGELQFKDLPSVIFKEFRTALLCGATLAAACFAKIMIVDNLIFGNDAATVMVALVVSMAMFATVIVAKIIGCSLPMIANKLGFDPAVMASPFITTTVDALSLLVYFGISSAILFR